MELKNIILKICAAVLFLAAGIVYVVLSGQEKRTYEFSTQSEIVNEHIGMQPAESPGTLERSLRSTDSDDTVGTGNGESTGNPDITGKVDINSADIALLTTLPGIGPVKAEAITAYRNEHGAFSSIEELMRVPGIKEGTYNKLKDNVVCVVP